MHTFKQIVDIIIINMDSKLWTLVTMGTADCGHSLQVGKPIVDILHTGDKNVIIRK